MLPQQVRLCATTFRGQWATAPASGNSAFLANDDERSLHAAYEDWLEELALHQPISHYRHDRTREASPGQSRWDNGDAHPKRIATLELRIMGRKVVVAVASSRPDLAPWEQCLH